MTDPKIHHMTMGYTADGCIDAVEFKVDCPRQELPF